jgi:outer membrane beta-barrel protein
VPTCFATWVILFATAFSISVHAQNEQNKTENAAPAKKGVVGDTDEGFDDGSGNGGGESAGENTEVEALYDKYDETQAKKREAKKKEEARKPVKEMTTLSELANLAPFADVAVIQRRFLPRTERFEFAGSGMTSLNNPFFNNLGLAVRGSYNFTEKYGIELQYMYFSNTKRSVTESLEQPPTNVKTSNLVTPKSYMGASFKWTPIYGKITFLNKYIVPFDFVFNGGLGLSKTDVQNEGTISLGAGQSFALSKSMAVRWDIIWNFYKAKTETATVGSSGTSSTNHNDLFLAAGMSFFIPEASYR